MKDWLRAAFVATASIVIAVGAGFVVHATGSKTKEDRIREMSGCIMEQIELSEENRDGYFPGQRERMLHWFIMGCIRDATNFKDFKKTDKQ